MTAQRTSPLAVWWADRVDAVRRGIAGREHQTIGTQRKHALIAARAAGAPATLSPFGNGDSKTATLGTYRKVGMTCLSGCELLGAGCYAQKNNVELHQRRASRFLASDTWAVLVAGCLAELRGEPLRLHVSGDVIRNGSEFDWPYILAVADITAALRIPVWSYSHCEVEGLDIGALRRAWPHVKVWDSTNDGPGCAVVVDNFADHRRQKGDIYCPAQLRDDITCRDCGACWDPDRSPIDRVRIVFHKH